MAASPPVGVPRWILGIAVALPVVLVAAVLVAAALVQSRHTGPVPLATVPAPEAGSAECTRLLAALPPRLPEAGNRREPAPPAPAGAAAWGAPPVVLRCGLDRPAELTVASQLLDISGVQFLEVPAPSDAATAGASAWVTVDRPVYVMVTLPPHAGSGPLQLAAEVIARTLPQQEPDIPR